MANRDNEVYRGYGMLVFFSGSGKLRLGKSKVIRKSIIVSKIQIKSL